MSLKVADFQWNPPFVPGPDAVRPARMHIRVDSSGKGPIVGHPHGQREIGHLKGQRNGCRVDIKVWQHPHIFCDGLLIVMIDPEIGQETVSNAGGLSLVRWRCLRWDEPDPLV